MKPTHLLLAAVLLLTATGLAASPDKGIVCHVGNEAGPGGEVYLDDPGCVPGEDNGYFCPDAGKIDLLVVGNVSAHLDNASHGWDGLTDYDPIEVGASGDGTEDSDGNGVDDGCEPPLPCPCWAEQDLLSVTAGNHLLANSCSAVSSLPFAAIIQNDQELENPEVEGGFAAFASDVAPSVCATRDFEPFQLLVSAAEAAACVSQIASRCAAIGDPLSP